MGRLWRSWSAVRAPLQLTWTGGTTDAPHWRVAEWGQAVTVRLAADFQDWILLDVKSVASDDQPAKSIWSWVRGRDDPSVEQDSIIATAHRLRVLLYQTQGVNALGQDGPDGPPAATTVRRQTLASWTRTTFSGSNLAQNVFSRRRSSGSVRRAPQRDGKADAWLVTEFQQTQWSPRVESLDDIPAISAERGRGG